MQAEKKIVSNTIYTMAGSLLMNGMLQLVIYPLLNRHMGSGQLGALLYITGLVAILCPSVGQALNASRLVVGRDHPVSNGDYNRLILLFGGIGTAAAIVVSAFIARDTVDSVGAVLLTALLLMATIFRYYGDVEYRLSLNYRQYFVYYAVLTGGYVLGFLLYLAVGNWYLIFLAGEVLALAYLAVTGTIFRRFFAASPWFSVACRRGGFLVFSYIITNFTLNIDRVALKYLIGNEAVTQYYVTSLIGKTLVLLVAPVNIIIISYLTKRQERIRRKQYLMFLAVGVGVAAAFFLFAQIATPIFVRLFYGKELLDTVRPLVTAVNLTQILGLLSAYLFIVVLTFTKEQWQLVLQIVHLVLITALVLIFTGPHGIIGFTLASLAANSVRVVAVAVLGLVKVEKGS